MLYETISCRIEDSTLLDVKNAIKDYVTKHGYREATYGVFGLQKSAYRWERASVDFDGRCVFNESDEAIRVRVIGVGYWNDEAERFKGVDLIEAFCEEYNVDKNLWYWGEL